MAILSLCVVTKNQEKLIEACLNVGRRIADEIIVVDLGSTDKTKEIAKKFTDKIFDFKWDNDFAAARNKALEHATGDWVFMLDANETLPVKYLPFIQELLKEKDYDAFSFSRKCFTYNKKRPGFIHQPHIAFPGYVTDEVVRLFRHTKKDNQPTTKYTYRVFESVIPSLIEQGKKIKKIGISLHNYEVPDHMLLNETLIKTLLTQQAKETPDDPKVNFDLATQLLSAKESKEGNTENIAQAHTYLKKAEQQDSKNILNKTLLFYQLGLTSFLLKKHQDATSYLRKSLEHQPSHFLSYLLLGRLLTLLQDYESVLQLVAQAKEQKLVHPELFNIGGYAFLQTNRPKEAIAAFSYAKKVLADNQKQATSDNLLLELVNNNLLSAFLRLGQYEQGIQLMEDALKTNPKTASYYFNAVQLYEKQEQIPKAIKIIQQAKKYKLNNEDLDRKLVVLQKRLEEQKK